MPKKRIKWDYEKLHLIQVIVSKMGYGVMSIKNLQRIIRETPKQNYGKKTNQKRSG